jgi:hypothetical protein
MVLPSHTGVDHIVTLLSFALVGSASSTASLIPPTLTLTPTPTLLSYTCSTLNHAGERCWSFSGEQSESKNQATLCLGSSIPLYRTRAQPRYINNSRSSNPDWTHNGTLGSLRGHQHPHSWRCHRQRIRTTEQLLCSMYLPL